MSENLPWKEETLDCYFHARTDVQGRIVGYLTPNSEALNMFFEKLNDAVIYTRIEPRTRDKDYKKALSFEVFDPMWMLCRQWQYGRFKAADGGSPVMVKVKTIRKKMDYVLRGNGEKMKYSTDVPLEREVEKQNIELTPYVSVESAMYFKKLIANVEKKSTIIKSLLKDFPLDSTPEEKKESLETLKDKKNDALNKFLKFYVSRSFDGVKLYDAIVANKIKSSSSVKKYAKTQLAEYKEWFKNKFYPCLNDGGNESKDCWNIRKLGYETEVTQGKNCYVAEDYDSGKLSWYSFDKKGADDLSSKSSEIKMLSYIPTPANIPGAPASRLWEFEERCVNMGEYENPYNFIGSVAMMQYITMFSNDWMITPLETETGTVLDVEGIMVKDSFGDRHFISKRAQELDKLQFKLEYPKTHPKSPISNVDKDFEKLSYTDRWDMFSCSYDDAYAKQNFTTSRGLFFPPTVLRCEESRPIEEVQFLRDEMANMVWGVETTLNNKCGGTMDGKTLSDSVLSEVDETNLAVAGSKEPITKDDEAEYSLLIQNRVPMNWIPFLPEQIPGSCREIAFRRATMPIFYNDGNENSVYKKVRPSTSLLAAKRDENKCVIPLYINEEELASCGVKVVKTAQRTRWFLGKSFNWVGNREIISEYQANSGLMFDELISPKTGKAIRLEPMKNDTPSEESAPEEAGE